MSISTFRNKRAVGTIVVILALLGATAAYAYFTSQGTGSGTAAVGTDAGVAITDVAFAGTLYPGASVPVSFTVRNNSTDTPAKVGKVVATTISGLPAGCSAADFSFADVTLNAEIAASGSTTGAGALRMANTAVNQDACKNAAPVLNLTVSNATI